MFVAAVVFYFEFLKERIVVCEMCYLMLVSIKFVWCRNLVYSIH
jgi:hypothetical protein